MSLEEVKIFFQKISQDDNILNQLKEMCNSDNEKGRYQRLVLFSNEKGFNFSVRELEQFIDLIDNIASEILEYL